MEVCQFLQCQAPLNECKTPFWRRFGTEVLSLVTFHCLERSSFYIIASIIGVTRGSKGRNSPGTESLSGRQVIAGRSGKSE